MRLNMGKDVVKSPKDQIPPPEKCYIPTRFALTVLLFFAMSLEYAHRLCLSVTIVVMVNSSALYKANTTIEDDDSCPVPQLGNETIHTQQGVYAWSPPTQGIILGAYFYGYVCTQILGGRMAELSGGKWPLGFSILIGSLLTIITPIAADIGVPAIVLVRVAMGLLHGICLPTAYAMFARWSPVEERSTLISLCIAGDRVGTVLSMPIAGYLCEHGFAGGWPSVYYVFGILGCIWFIFWACLAYNMPSDHPRISKSELYYIQKGHAKVEKYQKHPIPWAKVLCSMPIWSTAIVMFCGGWGQATLLTKLPTYLDRTLHMPIQQNSIVNSVIHFFGFTTMLFSGFVSDYMRSTKGYCPTKIRKGFQIITMLGPAVCISLIPSAGCQNDMVILLLALSMGFYGMCGGGHASIPADMAPHYSATIFGLVNAFGCISGILSPLVAGLIIDNAHTSIQKWSTVFYVASIFYLFGLVIFLIWASAEKQSWAHVQTKEQPHFYSDFPKKIRPSSKIESIEGYKYGSIT